MTKAFVTSIGEATTELCVNQLESFGFEVVLLQDASTLWSKLGRISQLADSDYLRVDADVIPNQNVLGLIRQTEAWWYQPLTYDWYKQDTGYGGIQFIRQPALAHIRNHIQEAKGRDRPETYLSRLPEFFKPRRFENFGKVCGLNGYGQKDLKRVKAIKERRGQLDNYNFDLVELLAKL